MELPVLGQEPSERADAARNRARILRAAERLYNEHGVGEVSMSMIAGAAGVGKGTLYRRFGDQNGLALALLDDHERQFQERVLGGPPHLGPTAGPRLRLEAFLVEALTLVIDHTDLYRLAEKGGSRTTSGLYAFYRAHVSHLLDLVDIDIDSAYLADLLLASLDAHLVTHQLHDRGFTPQRLTDGLRQTVRTLLSVAAESDHENG